MHVNKINKRDPQDVAFKLLSHHSSPTITIIVVSTPISPSSLHAELAYNVD